MSACLTISLAQYSQNLLNTTTTSTNRNNITYSEGEIKQAPQTNYYILLYILVYTIINSIYTQNSDLCYKVFMINKIRSIQQNSPPSYLLMFKYPNQANVRWGKYQKPG